MGKIGDIGIVLGLGIVGGVLFMFATGRWKLPELKLPELKLPTFEVPFVEVPAALKEPVKAAEIQVTKAAEVAIMGKISPLWGMAESVKMLFEGIPKAMELAAPKVAPTPTPARAREIPVVEAIMKGQPLPSWDPMRGLQLQMRP